MGKVRVLYHVKALLAEKDKRDSQRFDAQTSAINAALQAAKEAVTKAETATERRFESVNEFRAQLSDQTKTFASSERVDIITDRLNRMEGHSGGLNDGWKWLLAIAALAVPVVLFILK